MVETITSIGQILLGPDMAREVNLKLVRKYFVNFKDFAVKTGKSDFFFNIKGRKMNWGAKLPRYLVCKYIF